jgi:hypothetical protein
VKVRFPEQRLERVLEALERELLEATDAEILRSAHDLGMKPEMKGSAAFLGLRYAAARPQFADFFGFGEWALEQLATTHRLTRSPSGKRPRVRRADKNPRKDG